MEYDKDVSSQWLFVLLHWRTCRSSKPFILIVCLLFIKALTSTAIVTGQRTLLRQKLLTEVNWSLKLSMFSCFVLINREIQNMNNRYITNGVGINNSRQEQIRVRIHFLYFEFIIKDLWQINRMLCKMRHKSVNFNHLARYL
jgi:hypothetical protein